jgi:hypothetical protein
MAKLIDNPGAYFVPSSMNRRAVGEKSGYHSCDLRLGNRNDQATTKTAVTWHGWDPGAPG